MEKTASLLNGATKGVAKVLAEALPAAKTAAAKA